VRRFGRPRILDSDGPAPKNTLAGFVAAAAVDPLGWAARTPLDEIGRIRYWDVMGLLRRTTLVGGVWLTAAATLVAAFPDARCVCPDGRVMPLCFGPSSCPQGDRSPGERPSAAPVPGKSCCQGEGARPTSEAQGGSSLSCGGCRRTLTPSALVADASASPHLAAKALAALGSAAPAAASLSPTPAAFGPQGGWMSCHAPPPTDLVVSLQRFVI
jgi:hypothetical protein